MSHTRQEQMEAFGRFLDILDELRVKCPWDRKQTNESLRPNTIEETYELCDALMRDDKKEICKELGDVLLHVAFYAKIGSETGDFDIKDVCDKLCDKLIFRHPHVFGEVKAETAGQVSENWEQLKLKEKDGNKSVLSGVPAALPSLIKAYRIQDKARNVGFDWEEREQVWDKVKEEIGEFQEEVANMDKEKAEAEFGDVMFSLINAARLYKINPDNALELTNQKFIRRFNYLEEHTIKEGKSLKDMSLEEMDAIWNEAKKKGLYLPYRHKKTEALFPPDRASILLKQSVCSYESDALFFFISSLNRLPCLCYDSYLLSFRGENASLHVARERSSCLKESF